MIGLLSLAWGAPTLYSSPSWCPDDFEPSRWTPRSAAGAWERFEQVVIDEVVHPAAPVALPPETAFALRSAPRLVPGATGRIVVGGLHVLIRSSDDTLHVTTAPRTVTPVDVDAVMRRAGTTFEDGEGRWSAEERRAVALGLEALTDRERAVMRGLRFIREAVDDDSHDGLQASGRFQPDEHPIVRLFDGRSCAFDGPPGRALPPRTSTILHELGHAFGHGHRVAVYALGREVEALHTRGGEDYNGVREAHQRLQEADRQARTAYEEAMARGDRAAAVAAVADMEERAPERARLTVERERVTTLRADMVARLEALHAAWTLDPVHEAYAALPGALQGPTAYGTTNPRESFAESFELYHLEPEALRRVSPAVHAWFAADGHIQALEGALREVQRQGNPTSE